MKIVAFCFSGFLAVMTSASAACPGADSLRGRWLEFEERIRRGGAAGDSEHDPYYLLAARYCEPHRAYHTLVHVGHALRELDEAREVAEDPEAVELALWFHDIVYDIGSAQNEEESARLAGEAALELGLGEERAARVSELILATRHDAAPSVGDAELVVDIDLAILGQPWERFDAYEDEIRIEYAPVIEERGVAGFNAGRTRILKRFLDRPTIYSTEHFRRKYEEAARANLQRSIERLENPPWTEPGAERHNRPES